MYSLSISKQTVKSHALSDRIQNGLCLLEVSIVLLHPQPVGQADREVAGQQGDFPTCPQPQRRRDIYPPSPKVDFDLIYVYIESWLSIKTFQFET